MGGGGGGGMRERREPRERRMRKVEKDRVGECSFCHHSQREINPEKKFGTSLAAACSHCHKQVWMVIEYDPSHSHKHNVHGSDNLLTKGVCIMSLISHKSMTFPHMVAILVHKYVEACVWWVCSQCACLSHITYSG